MATSLNNILYFEGLPYIIDVSQSVEPAHPNSYEFLAKDCKNVNDFFRRKEIMTLSDLELFEYILDERHIKSKEKKSQKRQHSIDEESKNKEIVFEKHRNEWNDVIDVQVLEHIHEVCKERWETMSVNEDEVNDTVNLNSKKMRSLFDIDNAFQIHQNKAKFSQVSKFLLKETDDLDGMDQLNEMDNDSENETESESDEDDGKEDLNENTDSESTENVMCMFPEAPKDALSHKKDLNKDELKQMRKANKKIVKAENKERRKHKMPKKVKKRKIKVARQKAGKSVWKG